MRSVHAYNITEIESEKKKKNEIKREIKLALVKRSVILSRVFKWKRKKMFVNREQRKRGK